MDAVGGGVHELCAEVYRRKYRKGFLIARTKN